MTTPPVVGFTSLNHSRLELDTNAQQCLRLFVALGSGLFEDFGAGIEIERPATAIAPACCCVC